MSLMEFCEIEEGKIVPTYTRLLEPIRCELGDHPVEPVMALGALWVCPACFDEAEQVWEGRNRKDLE
ncbi:MAG: hypothetical protein M1537_01665 [Nitrospirae bacterium]|nr:hypothetical protein [Nitrospirota bacterium]MCL5284176.1 hypothetical protein [Nitrospirota bacterium]